MTAETHSPLGHTETKLRKAIELLFFAYRDFTGEPDKLLARHGLGRAHHRVIYFVGRHPGITSGELLGILNITKQSLARVLKPLLEDGYLEQTQGTADRRTRHWRLSAKGQALEADLSRRQMRRIARAYDECDTDAVKGFEAVLAAITDEKERFS